MTRSHNTLVANLVLDNLSSTTGIAQANLTLSSNQRHLSIAHDGSIGKAYVTIGSLQQDGTIGITIPNAILLKAWESLKLGLDVLTDAASTLRIDVSDIVSIFQTAECDTFGGSSLLVRQVDRLLGKA